MKSNSEGSRPRRVAARRRERRHRAGEIGCCRPAPWHRVGADGEPAGGKRRESRRRGNRRDAAHAPRRQADQQRELDHHGSERLCDRSSSRPVNIGNSAACDSDRRPPAGTGYTIATAASRRTVSSAGLRHLHRDGEEDDRRRAGVSCTTGRPTPGRSWSTRRKSLRNRQLHEREPSETTVGTRRPHPLAGGPNPGALTYAWSVRAAGSTTPPRRRRTSACTAPGAVTLTVRVTDGPVPSTARADARRRPRRSP